MPRFGSLFHRVHRHQSYLHGIGPYALRTKEPSWTSYSALLLILFLFFQITQWPFSPKFLDAYYHLAVMKGFEEAGGYVTSAFWEYAPAGRPHLYPPALHILMLSFYKLGLSAISVARLVDLAAYPIFLFAFWRVYCR